MIPSLHWPIFVILVCWTLGSARGLVLHSTPAQMSEMDHDGPGAVTDRKSEACNDNVGSLNEGSMQKRV